MEFNMVGQQVQGSKENKFAGTYIYGEGKLFE